MQIYGFGMIFIYNLLLQLIFIHLYPTILKMNTRLILLFIFTIAITTFCFAAAPPPPPSGGAGCWPPPCVPIDGGISLLIAAGAIYGGKTLYSKRKKNTL